jgi:hypothetical protein
MALAACVLLVPLRVPAQMFIRVAPPSVNQQDQDAVSASPYGSGGTPQPQAGGSSTGGQREAILLDNGQNVSMVDSNGAPIKKSDGWFGDWRPNFYASLVLAYDDNIFTQRKKVADFVTTFSPGIVLGWGDYRSEIPPGGNYGTEFTIPLDIDTAYRYFYIDYHPTVEIFAKTTGEDDVEEDAIMSGSYLFSKLTLQGRLQYQTLSDTDIDVGDRVDRTIYSGLLAGTYSFDDKTSLESTLTVTSEQFSGGYESYSEIVDRTYVNYQYGPKTVASVGAGLGYLTPQSSANQIYEQLLSRVRWTVSDKLYLTGTLGVEFRQSDDGIDKIDGVYDAAATYLPFDGTSLALTSSRLTEPSDAEFGQDIVVTNVQLQVTQRFLGKFYTSGSVEYQNANYERVSSGSGFTRTDNTVNLLLSVGMNITKYGGVQLAYRLYDNESTLYARSFNDNQVSLRLNALY